MSLHSKQTKIHVIENWSFANATARLANGLYINPDDLGKIGYQQDSFTYWRLILITNPGAAATPTWQAVGGGGSNLVENGLAITSLSGVESTSLKNKEVTGLPFGYKIIITINDSDSFFTYQNGDPDANVGDVATPVLHTRWRKTGGY
jgi:hypothetical protein